VFNNIFSPTENRAVYEIMWKNVVKCSTAGQATDDNTAHAQLHAGYPTLQTHSEYVILIAFPRQLLCYAYIACFVL